MRTSQLVFFTLIVFPVACLAGSYGITPGSTIRLGGGFDPVNPERTFATILYMPAKEEMFLESAGDLSANMAEVNEESRVSEVLGIDAYAKARYGAVKADAAYSRLKEMKFDSRTLNIALSVRKTYAAEALAGGIILTPMGIALLSENVKDKATADAFLNAGGVEVVSSITRGSFIYVVYQFSFKDTSTKDSISASFSAAYAGSAGGVQALQQILSSDRSIRVEWTVLSEGVNAQEAADSVVKLITTAPGDVQKVKESMAAFVNSSTYATSRIIQFKTIPAVELSQIAFSDKKPHFDGHELRVASEKAKVLEKTNLVGQANTTLVLANYVAKAPIKYRAAERDAELLTKINDLKNYRDTLIEEIQNTGLKETPVSAKPPAFDAIRYVRFPLISFSEYRRSHSWGGRVNCAGADRTQCNPLTWTFTPKIVLHLPGLIEKVSFKANDGSYTHNYEHTALKKQYETEISENIVEGYGSFYHPYIYTQGGNAANDGTANGYIQRVLAENPAKADKANRLEVIDISGRSTTITLPSFAGYSTNNSTFSTGDYKETLACEAGICYLK